MRNSTSGYRTSLIRAQPCCSVAKHMTCSTTTGRALPQDVTGLQAFCGLAGILNEKPKYVVSSSDPAPDWQAQRTAATADSIRTLRDDVKGTLLLVASPTLARTLVQWGLVDDYHIAMSPTVAGRGPRFLDGLEERFMPSLIDVTRLRSGVLFLHYDFASAG